MPPSWQDFTLKICELSTSFSYILDDEYVVLLSFFNMPSLFLLVVGLLPKLMRLSASSGRCSTYSSLLSPSRFDLADSVSYFVGQYFKIPSFLNNYGLIPFVGCG